MKGTKLRIGHSGTKNCVFSSSPPFFHSLSTMFGILGDTKRNQAFKTLSAGKIKIKIIKQLTKSSPVLKPPLKH